LRLLVVLPRIPRTHLSELKITFSGRVVPFAALTQPSTNSAPHSLGALGFAIAGPGIRIGDRISDAHLVDVLPTLAAAWGLPIPTGLDGRCLGLFA